MPFWVQMGSNVVPKSVKWVHLGPQKSVIIAANDDDTFLDPAGSPYGSVGSPFGSHVGSKVVPKSVKWVEGAFQNHNFYHTFKPRLVKKSGGCVSQP